MGIEPTSSAWKAEVLPLNYTRNLAKKLLITCNSQNPGHPTRTVPPHSTSAKIDTDDLSVAVVGFFCDSLFIYWIFALLSASHRNNIVNQLVILLPHPIPKNLVEGVGFEPT